MTSTKQRPIEFFVNITEQAYGPDETHMNGFASTDKNRCFDPSIHVIQYSAYQDTQEALKIALEALEIANNELLTVDDHAAYGKMNRYYSNEKSHELNKAIHKIQNALAEIRKLRGEK